MNETLLETLRIISVITCTSKKLVFKRKLADEIRENTSNDVIGVGSLHIAYQIKGSQQNPEQGTAGYKTESSSQWRSGTILRHTMQVVPLTNETCLQVRTKPEDN